ncbi:hypothetical protein GCM10009733_102330 [Nonomuraea maheshkhaliensis]|uniref:Uncharacterized protein n=1 Tax=Nonomuraea maheshkhaliensis TaxID=419590 RepID=A0ABN2HKG6_9ACTN
MSGHGSHAGRAGVAALLQQERELLEVGHGGRLDLVERADVRALDAQQPLQLAVEALGVAAQPVEVALQLLERGEDAPVASGVWVTEQAVQLAQPVGDGVEHGRLQRAGRLQRGHGVPYTRDRRLAPPGQRVVQVPALVLLGGGEAAGVVEDHVEQAPAGELFERGGQLLLAYGGVPARLAQPFADLLDRQGRFEPFAGLAEGVQDRRVQVGPLGGGEPEHLRRHPWRLRHRPAPLAARLSGRHRSGRDRRRDRCLRADHGRSALAWERRGAVWPGSG